MSGRTDPYFLWRVARDPEFVRAMFRRAPRADGHALFSVLVGAPAWRHVDLLPIVAARRRRGDPLAPDEDDDGIASTTAHDPVDEAELADAMFDAPARATAR